MAPSASSKKGFCVTYTSLNMRLIEMVIFLHKKGFNFTNAVLTKLLIEKAANQKLWKQTKTKTRMALPEQLVYRLEILIDPGKMPLWSVELPVFDNVEKNWEPIDVNERG